MMQVYYALIFQIVLENKGNTETSLRLLNFMGSPVFSKGITRAVLFSFGNTRVDKDMFNTCVHRSINELSSAFTIAAQI